MNKIRLASGNVKRNSLFQNVKNFINGYISTFNIWSDNPIVQILLILVPIIDLLTLIPPYSIGGTTIVVILNFIVFRLVTNR